MNDSRWVYSTETGRVCPQCGRAATHCACKQKGSNAGPIAPGDGVIRIRRETKGRKGKGVTTLTGFQISDPDLKQLAAKLKRLCGTGGSVKKGVILIQGDHRAALQTELRKQGFQVKLSGG